MSEMVERVAKALFLAAHPKSTWSRGASSSVWWFQAEAAIKAMREEDETLEQRSERILLSVP